MKNNKNEDVKYVYDEEGGNEEIKCIILGEQRSDEQRVENAMIIFVSPIEARNQRFKERKILRRLRMIPVFLPTYVFHFFIY